MKYDEIVLIGSGKIACDCLNELIGYTRNIIAIQSEKQQLSFLDLLCKSKGIRFKCIIDKNELTRFFLNRVDNVLIISANNNYIFPNVIINSKNLKIINFHNALLPNYPGRNATTWAIYNMEKHAGITWHYINNIIDYGDIIAQRQISLDNHITALDLTKRCMDQGYEVFKELLPNLLSCDIKGKKQICNIERRVYRSTEIPNNGFIDLSFGFDRIYAQLRSVDYGKYTVFPKLKLKVLGEVYEIFNYKFSSNAVYGGLLTFDKQKIQLGFKGKCLDISVTATSDFN